MNFSKLFATLNGILKNSNITGMMDGDEFKDVSFAGSGKNAFVVKGWIDPQEGPAVRYRADWGSLNEGEVFYQNHPGDKGWLETEEGYFKLERGDGNISIMIAFKTEDGEGHHVRFTADLDLMEIFGSLID